MIELIPFIFIFGLIPYSFYKAFPGKGKWNKYRLMIAIAIPIGLGVTWSNWINFIENDKLNKEGELTAGVIIKAWKSKGVNGRIENLLKAKFFYGKDRIETFSHTNNKGLKIGDTVTIKFVSTNPHIYIIMELEE